MQRSLALRFSCERNEDSPSVDTRFAGNWIVWDSNGESVKWRGFYTGPKVLADAAISDVCDQLLRVSPDELAALAGDVLRPRLASAAHTPSLFLHCATQTTKGFEGDLFEMSRGRMAYDCATYLETRAVYLAKSGDTCVGRTAPWREAVEDAAGDITAIDIKNTDYYYLSHQLLVSALDAELDGVAPPWMTRLIAAVADTAELAVRLYSLDVEMTIFLVWLARKASVPVMLVDANAPDVSRSWNQKSPLHPTSRHARDKSPQTIRVHDLLAAENRLSRLATDLGVDVATLPGYLLPRRGVSEEAFVEQSLDAAGLLVDRYDLSFGCLKPSEAGDGARIIPNVDLRDIDRLRECTRDAYRHGDDYLWEAHLTYRGIKIDSSPYIVAPSLHVFEGEIEPGATLQLMNGTTWTGNVYFDAQTSAELGIASDEYTQMRCAVEALVRGFRKKVEWPLVTAGFDFGIGSVGGRFGAETLVALQDMNISSHGAVYLRAFVRRMNQAAQGLLWYGASMVVRPAKHVDIDMFRGAVRREWPNSHVIALVPGRWSMIACADVGPMSAGVAVARVRASLAASGLLLNEKYTEVA